MEIGSAEEIIQDFNSIKGMRATWENHWKECADYVFPKHNGFNEVSTDGDKKTTLIYDGTPIRANNMFAAILEAMLTPRNQKWHKLRPADPTLEQSVPVKQYFEKVNDILFKARYRANANFSSVQHESYLSLGCFGTSCKFIEDTLDGIRYSCIWIGDIFIKTDYSGNTDTVFRLFKLTARQAMQKFKEGLSKNIINCTDSSKKFSFLHCVAPNKEYNENSRNEKNMKFRSYYIDLDSKNFVSVGGYTSMPYITPRYTVAPSEEYGRGPTMEALPDIKMLNEMSKTDIRMSHRAVDPTLLASKDLANSVKSGNPGQIIFDGIDENGRPKMVPMQTGSNLNISDVKIEQRRQAILKSFFVDVFQTVLDHPNMSATQVMEISQQKGMLLSPAMGRLQSEDLSPMIERELDILSKAGKLPPMPDELMQAGAEFKIEYDSPLSRSQKMEDVLGIVKTYEIMGQLAQFDQGVLDNFDFNEDLRIIADANGHPAKSMNSKEKIEQLRKQRQEAQEMQAMLQQAPQLAKGAKDINEIAG